MESLSEDELKDIEFMSEPNQNQQKTLPQTSMAIQTPLSSIKGHQKSQHGGSS